MRLGNYIDQLIDAEVLRRSTGDYPILLLAEGARDVLKGEADVQLRAPKGGLEAGSRRRRRSRDGAVVEARPLADFEQVLFDAMRTLRRALASDLGVPPYVVFSDATLEELARARPRDQAAMLDVKGIGPKKFEQFGARFLELINAGQAEQQNDSTVPEQNRTDS